MGIVVEQPNQGPSHTPVIIWLAENARLTYDLREARRAASDDGHPARKSLKGWVAETLIQRRKYKGTRATVDSRFQLLWDESDKLHRIFRQPNLAGNATRVWSERCIGLGQTAADDEPNVGEDTLRKPEGGQHSP